MSGHYAVIGGSGLYTLGPQFELEQEAKIPTPYGETSAPVQHGHWQGHALSFLARHGAAHKIPPHKINYRANLWALKQQGVTHIIAVNAVGGITPELAPRVLALPDQIIDYSCGREQSFADGENGEVLHIDFTYPYSEGLRAAILAASKSRKLDLVASGTYGCSNGPRLETSAEIKRMQRDGCTMVGMTGMPEAALARELSIEYASLALVVNRAAGIDENTIAMAEIMQTLELGVDSVRQLILATLEQVQA